jgi:hypothetical protein
MIDDMIEKVITNIEFIIKPNFLLLNNTIKTISEIQWNCISAAIYQVCIAHFIVIVNSN